MKCTIFIDILLLLGVIYLFSMCSNDNTTTHTTYSINHYVDTISGHVILTTVCDERNYHISVSTLELNNN